MTAPNPPGETVSLRHGVASEILGPTPGRVSIKVGYEMADAVVSFLLGRELDLLTPEDIEEMEGDGAPARLIGAYLELSARAAVQISTLQDRIGELETALKAALGFSGTQPAPVPESVEDELARELAADLVLARGRTADHAAVASHVAEECVGLPAAEARRLADRVVELIETSDLTISWSGLGYTAHPYGVRPVDAGADLELLCDAARAVVASQVASAVFLQRKIRVGFGKAGRLLGLLEDAGVIRRAEAKRWDVLVAAAQADTVVAILRRETPDE